MSCRARTALNDGRQLGPLPGTHDNDVAWLAFLTGVHHHSVAVYLQLEQPLPSAPASTGGRVILDCIASHSLLAPRESACGVLIEFAAIGWPNPRAANMNGG